MLRTFFKLRNLKCPITNRVNSFGTSPFGWKKSTKYEYKYESLPVDTRNRGKFSVIFFVYVVSGIGAPFAIVQFNLMKMGPTRELFEDEY
ncbi:hypothetical protein M8J76_006284 [Diaphorina citri]|nr:hypothetical protein M8J75_006599 [Diaphorina citri]KAI5740699.1 hypothetical protein M8J76_006284 [Diaphorina citri]